MSKQGNFQKSMSLFDLILIGMGAIFGSAWLFAVSNVASKAGPSGAFSWILGGAIILLIGLVYAELGAALPVPEASFDTPFIHMATLSAI